jgi:hypothetical protein
MISRKVNATGMATNHYYSHGFSQSDGEADPEVED